MTYHTSDASPHWWTHWTHWQNACHTKQWYPPLLKDTNNTVYWTSIITHYYKTQNTQHWLHPPYYVLSQPMSFYRSYWQCKQQPENGPWGKLVFRGAPQTTDSYNCIPILDPKARVDRYVFIDSPPTGTQSSHQESTTIWEWRAFPPCQREGKRNICAHNENTWKWLSELGLQLGLQLWTSNS